MHGQVFPRFLLWKYFLQKTVLPSILRKRWSFPLRISSLVSQFTADLVIFPEEILNGKLHFCAVHTTQKMKFSSKDFFSVFCGFVNVCEVTPKEFAMLRNYKVKPSPVRDCSHMASAKKGRGRVLSHDDFVCIFGGTLAFFLTMGKGTKFLYFLDWCYLWMSPKCV